MRSFVQFVRHRVNEILKLTNKDEWAYCSTDENPADLGSRGVFASQLKENQLWWRGPPWLASKAENWPAMIEMIQTPESLVEEKKIYLSHMCVFCAKWLDFSKSLSKL